MQQSELVDLRPGWRGRVAHAASPWRWGRAWFAVYLVGLVAVAVAWVVSALTGPTSGAGKAIELALAVVAVAFLVVRPGLRAMQLRASRSPL